jgi:hypothetical protein
MAGPTGLKDFSHISTMEDNKFRYFIASSQAISNIILQFVIDLQSNPIFDQGCCQKSLLRKYKIDFFGGMF